MGYVFMALAVTAALLMVGLPNLFGSWRNPHPLRSLGIGLAVLLLMSGVFIIPAIYK
jgi:hypothetical protein